MDALRQYTVKDYPLGLLISPDGRVLWRGTLERLSDRVIDAYRARVRLLPPVPRSCADVGAALQAGRYGEVERALEPRRACRPSADPDCVFVQEALGYVAWLREQGAGR